MSLDDIQIQAQITGVQAIKQGIETVAESERQLSEETRKAAEEAQKQADAIEREMQRLRDEAAMAGKSKSEQEAYKLAKMGANQATIDQAKALVQQAEAQEDASKKTESHGKGLVSLNAIYKNLKDGVVGWIGGFAGFAAIQQIIDKYLQALEKVREAQRQIASESRGTEGSIQKLAVQFGDVSEEGLQTAKQTVRRLGVAGGMDEQTATEFAVSADVALGKRGGLKKNMGVAQEIAGIAGALNLKAEESGKLIELLDTAGALESPEKTQ
jgi:hypothetical protein